MEITLLWMEDKGKLGNESILRNSRRVSMALSGVRNM